MLSFKKKILFFLKENDVKDIGNAANQIIDKL